MSEMGAKHLQPNPPPRARETPSQLRCPSPGTRGRQHSSSSITCCKWKSQALRFKSGFEPVPLHIVGEMSAALTGQPMQSRHPVFCLSFPTMTTMTCKTHKHVQEDLSFQWQNLFRSSQVRINGNSVKIKWQSHNIPPCLARWHLPKCSCVAEVGEVGAALETAWAGAPRAASLLTPSPAEKEEPAVS